MAAKRCILSAVRDRRWIFALVAVSVIAVAVLLLLPPSVALPEPSQALKTASDGLTNYDLTLSFDAEDETLAVTAKIDYVNTAGETLETLILRTFAGAYAKEETSPAALEELFDSTYPEGFSAGGVTLMGTWWNGEIVKSAYLDTAQTALSVDIPPLESGARGEMTVRMLLSIPHCAHRYGEADGIYHLGNALPVMAVYQNGAWRTDEYYAIGDPFLSDCANYTVSVKLPEGYVPACTAYLTEKDGVWTGRALAVRDLALSIGKDYVLRQQMQNGVLIRSFALTEGGAQRALNDAARAISTFSSLYGAYPYPVFTVAEAGFPFDGMEYPAFVMIGSGMYLESEKDSLELVIAHETAHQWFYALVGSDQINDPWQDEALCEYAMLRYVQERYGQSSADTLRAYRVEAPMRESVPGELTPGSPLAYFGDYTAYSAVVYGRGAALVLALESYLGDVDDFLKRYCEEYAYHVASREDFVRLLNDYAKADLRPLLTDYLDTVME